MDAAACLRADFAPGNVPKGVAWSPDGTCLLTATEDARVRLYEVPGAVLDGGAPPSRDWAETFACAEGEAVYDYKWYPQMHSDNPISCCFASCGRDQPAHLWDAFTGACRGSYVGRDHLDENAPAYSLAFSPSGARLFCGGDRCVRVFDTGRCGSDCDARPTAATRRAKSGVKGLLGALACRDEAVYAVGSYGGQVAVYDGREPSTGPALRVCKDKPLGGVTALAFDGRGRLFAACRNERDRACVRGFDLRTGRVAVRCRRGATPSHQRLGFDLREDRLLAGGADGRVVVFDVAPGSSSTDAAADAPVVAELPRAPDCCNGAAFHPHRPLVALASGQRHYADPGSSSDDDGAARTAVAVPAPAVAVLKWPDA